MMHLEDPPNVHICYNIQVTCRVQKAYMYVLENSSIEIDVIHIDQWHLVIFKVPVPIIRSEINWLLIRFYNEVLECNSI